MAMQIQGALRVFCCAAFSLPREAHGEQVQQGCAKALVHEQATQAASLHLQACHFPQGQGGNKTLLWISDRDFISDSFRRRARSLSKSAL
jgi:hypothetical protein